MLHYYRCQVCLTVMTHTAYTLDARCVCGGKLAYLGEVHGDRLLRPHQQPPCDGRCTSARGPKCDCQCGGENHGSNLLVTTYTDAGEVTFRPIDTEAALKRAEEYRAAQADVLTAIKERYGDAWENYRLGNYLPGTVYQSLRDIDEVLQGVKALLNHKNRIARLRELAVKIRTR